MVSDRLSPLIPSAAGNSRRKMHWSWKRRVGVSAPARSALTSLLRFAASSLAIELLLVLLDALNVSGSPKTKSLAANAQRLWWSQLAAAKPSL
jgi:hypothetical protein